MNAVGIDVSKGKSTVAIMRPFGEVIAEPFEVSHTDTELRKLACFLEKLPGETRIVMEYTGSYWQPIAKVLHDAGFFVSAVNALLIYKYGNNSIRKGKTDKLDAVKIANYCLDRWTDLERYSPTDQIRQTLKTCRRQYDQYIRLKVNLKNNLIALLDGTFPGINTLLKSAPEIRMGTKSGWILPESFGTASAFVGTPRKRSQTSIENGVPKPVTDSTQKRLWPSIPTLARRWIRFQCPLQSRASSPMR